MSKCNVTEQAINKIIALYNNEKSIKEIATIMNRHPDTIRRTLQKQNLFKSTTKFLSNDEKDIIELEYSNGTQESENYSDEELNYLSSTIQKLHEKYGLGVCIKKSLHTLFHSIYGQEPNAEQFYKFISEYKNGKYVNLEKG